MNKTQERALEQTREISTRRKIALFVQEEVHTFAGKMFWEAHNQFDFNIRSVTQEEYAQLEHLEEKLIMLLTEILSK